MDFHITKSFKHSDFACKCGRKHASPMSLEFVFKLEKMQNILGDTYNLADNITSGFRCEDHNKTVGGASARNGSIGSMHLYGRAVDIYCHDSKIRFAIVEAAQKVGMGDVSLSYQFIHVDDRDTKQMRMY